LSGAGALKDGSRIRLGALLVRRGLVESPSAATAAVLAGEVYVNGARARTVGQVVPPDAAVEIRPRRPRFVGRGGEKLAHALQAFGLSVGGATAVDVGASTGGFTDCLLQYGAARVYAVDVGRGQLDWRLRNDPRVVVLERQDIRGVLPDRVGGAVDLATVDVAFTRLADVLPAVARLVRPGGSVVVLVKPQFEVPPKLAPRGVVRDPATHREVLRRVLAQAARIGLVAAAVTPSPLTGADGNLEFFVQLRCGGPAGAIDVDAVVARAHALVTRRGGPRMGR